MKALSCVLVAAGLLGNESVGAQEAPDFSGIYSPPVFVGVPAVAEPDDYPFTAAAERAFNAYDPLTADPRQADDCAPETMPGILWSGAPMQITQENDRILMRFERGNTVRSISMGGPPPSPEQTHTALGYSVGNWVGDVLQIDTTHMLGGVIRNNRGHPLSAEARITERYWREPGEQDLQLELLVDDPANYTEAFTLGREWIWAPDDRIRPWECISLGTRDSEPDIDELARMLEEL